MDHEPVKKCPCCQAKKFYHEFSKSNYKKNGLSTYCKKCTNQKARLKNNKKRGNKRPYAKYLVDENCFNNDDLFTWYMGGLIAADGYVVGRGIGLTLKGEDLETIELFKNFLKYDGPIRFYKKIYPQCMVKGVPKIIESIKDKFNITANKSLTLKPPRYTPNLNCALAYIIGYIDGDGCIYISNKVHQMQILGTHDVLNYIINIFSQILGFPVNLKPRLSSSKNVYQINLSGNFRTGKYSKLIKIMLNLNVPKMSRKWDKLENLNNYVHSSPLLP